MRWRGQYKTKDETKQAPEMQVVTQNDMTTNFCELSDFGCGAGGCRPFQEETAVTDKKDDAFEMKIGTILVLSALLVLPTSDEAKEDEECIKKMMSFWRPTDTDSLQRNGGTGRQRRLFAAADLGMTLALRPRPTK